MGDWRCIEVRYNGSTDVMTDVYRPMLNGRDRSWLTLIQTDRLIVEEWVGPKLPYLNHYLIWVHSELVDA